MSRNHAIAALVISSVISFVLAMTADMTNLELGALANLVWPPIIGLLSLLMFLLLWWLIKDSKIRILITIVLCLYNIYIGLALHLEKDYWPLVLF